jgi:MSHA biogenesis protein MshM
MLYTIAGDKIMYLKHWQLDSHPFSNTPDTQMYFGASEQSDPATGILLSIRDALANLIVLSGEEGTGKTICMRQMVDQLDPNSYNIVFVSNPALNFPELLREIVGQLQHRVCPRNTVGYFTHEFANAVEISAKEDRRVLVFIDNYRATATPDLTTMHSLLTSNQYAADSLSLIVAGSPDLSERLQETDCRTLFQGLAAFYTTEDIESRDAMSRYIAHRLECAGRSGPNPFSESAIDAIWSCEANRNPRALNSICRVCLKQSAQVDAQQVDIELVVSVHAELKSRALEEIPVASPQLECHDVEVPAPAIVPPEPPTVVDKAKERLASQLATNRIKHLESVRDPFEAWSSAREEILSTLQSTNLKRVAS